MLIMGQVLYHLSLILLVPVYFQQSIRVAEKITQKVEGQLSKSQKEFLLRQQASFLTPFFLYLSNVSTRVWDYIDKDLGCVCFGLKKLFLF